MKNCLSVYGYYLFPFGVRIIVLSQRWTSLQRRFITMYDKNNEREEMLNAKPKQMFPQPLD